MQLEFHGILSFNSCFLSKHILTYPIKPPECHEFLSLAPHKWVRLFGAKQKEDFLLNIFLIYTIVFARPRVYASIQNKHSGIQSLEVEKDRLLLTQDSEGRSIWYNKPGGSASLP